MSGWPSSEDLTLHCYVWAPFVPGCLIKCFSCQNLQLGWVSRSINLSAANICYPGALCLQISMENTKIWLIYICMTIKTRKGSDGTWCLWVGSMLSDLFVADVACWYCSWPVNNKDNYDIHTMEILTHRSRLSLERSNSAPRSQIWWEIVRFPPLSPGVLLG